MLNWQEQDQTTTVQTSDLIFSLFRNDAYNKYLQLPGANHITGHIHELGALSDAGKSWDYAGFS